MLQRYIFFNDTAKNFSKEFQEKFGSFGNNTYLCNLGRKVGRVIDRAGLEIRYTPFGYRGFESLTFRKKESMLRSLKKREPHGFPFSIRVNV